MIEFLLLVLKTLGLALAISKFTPLQWFWDAIAPQMNKHHVDKFIFNLVTILTGCFSCCSLWVGIIGFGFWVGITAWVVAYFYNQLLAPWVDKIRFQ